MPTYEYDCGKCKKTFEAFQSMKDSAFETCPKELCRQKTWGKGKVRRLLGTGAGLIFKGSGFYITDYRSEGYKTAAQKESGAGEPKKADAGTSSTPAAPAAPAASSAPAAPSPAPAAKEKPSGKKTS